MKLSGFTLGCDTGESSICSADNVGNPPHTFATAPLPDAGNNISPTHGVDQQGCTELNGAGSGQEELDGIRGRLTTPTPAG